VFELNSLGFRVENQNNEELHDHGGCHEDKLARARRSRHLRIESMKWRDLDIGFCKMIEGKVAPRARFELATLRLTAARENH